MRRVIFVLLTLLTTQVFATPAKVKQANKKVAKQTLNNDEEILQRCPYIYSSDSLCVCLAEKNAEFSASNQVINKNSLANCARTVEKIKYSRQKLTGVLCKNEIAERCPVEFTRGDLDQQVQCIRGFEKVVGEYCQSAISLYKEVYDSFYFEPYAPGILPNRVATHPALNPKGCVRGNCKEGKSLYIYSDGSWYEGDYHNGQAEGYGTYHDVNGTENTGYMKNNKTNGPNVQTWLDGSYYVGDFRDGVHRGYGKFYDTETKVMKSGVWQNDQRSSNAPFETK